MTTAFVVLAHGAPHTLSKLLARLSPYPTYIHLDGSVEVGAFARVALAPSYQHVELADQRYCLHWGGYSIVQAMMETLDLALAHSPEVHHYTFLSGECYPLRPVKEFVSLLESTPTPVLCRAFNLETHSLGATMGMDRIRRRHWLDGAVGHIRKVTPRYFGAALRRGLRLATWPFPVRVPDGTHAAGSQWVSIPRELAAELVSHYKSGGFEYLRNALAPDEIAIPSYVYSTHWKSATPYGGLEPATEATIAGYANFHWLRPSMRGYLDAADIVAARKSGAYFVRKVSVENTPGILNFLHDETGV